MKKRLSSKLLLCLVGLVLMLPLAGSAFAARQSGKTTSAPRPIPEQYRPWPGWPWVITGGLGAAIIAVAMKNAKRSHLD